MNSYTQTKVFAASKKQLYGFLANIQNLPQWATGFSREVKGTEGNYKVVTPQGGELFVRLDTDEQSGVVDIYTGPTAERMACFPGRVVALSENMSVYSFTNIQYPGMPDEDFAGINEGLIEEFENIKSHVEPG